MRDRSEVNLFIETPNINNPEVRFKILAEKTKGVLVKVEDQSIQEAIPYIINYHQKQPVSEGNIRIYRGVNYVPAFGCDQLPSILRTADIIDQELIGLTVELGDNPSDEVYDKIIAKNEQLGNNNYRIIEAKKYIRKIMLENKWNYSDSFKSMHRWKNIASPYVSTSSEFNHAFGYSMLGLPGMVIVADIPESSITREFFEGFDKEISVKGPIKQKYFRSILMIARRHDVYDKQFQESVNRLVK